MNKKWSNKKIENFILNLAKKLGRYPTKIELINNFGWGIVNAIEGKEKFGDNYRRKRSYSDFLVEFQKNHPDLPYQLPNTIIKTLKKHNWNTETIEYEFVNYINQYKKIPNTNDLNETFPSLYSALKRSIRKNEFNGINNYHEFVEYIKNKYPELSKFPTSRSINIQRRNKNNKESIEKEFIDSIKKLGKIPTTRELEKITGGLYSIINYNIKNGLWKDINNYSQFVDHILKENPELKIYNQRKIKKTFDLHVSESYLITPEILGKAIFNVFNSSFNYPSEEECKKMAEYILNFFGYGFEILDNSLESSERSIFYQLEEFEILKSEILETSIPYDSGKNWRISLWKLNPEKIMKHYNTNKYDIKNSEIIEENIYFSLDDSVWTKQ